MQATVKNFRGIKDAQISVSKIALITGKNGAGKTSIARAIAAAATGKAVPFDKLTKKDCAIMLHNGTKTGMVELENNDGGTLIEWPKADVQSSGRPPFSSDIAAGLMNFMALEEKKKLASLIALLKAEVTKDEFAEALEAINISSDGDTAKIIWKTIEAQGWEAAFTRAKETGSRLKGAWENISGEKYGSKKAAEFFPTDWDDSLLETDEVALIKAVADANTILENLISKNAVSQSEIAQLNMQAESQATLEKQKIETEALIAGLEKELKAVEDKLRQNPSPDAKQELECPHCQGKIHIKGVSGTEYILSKADNKVSPAMLKEARAENAKLCGEQQNVNRRLADARKNLQSIIFDIDLAIKAKVKLEKYGTASLDITPEDIATARQDVARAQGWVNILKQYQDAKKAAQQIIDNQAIIDLLDETGLRRTKLGQCLDAFHAHYIEPLCESFGIQPIKLDVDMNVTIGKVTYQMLSASEQYRANIILQLAISQLEKASIIIIDGADILDQPGRGKILQAVIKVDLPTIICMTLNKPEQAPNLSDSGIGISYWVEGGVCSPFQSKKKEAA